MLKISEPELSGGAVVLRLEGRLVGPWVQELRQCCEPFLGEGRLLMLQLSEVEFVDPGGVALMAELRARGTSFVDSSPFITEQLKSRHP